MSTPKQIAVNRRNAEKSTGPRTAEGKAKTRLNLKHGLTAETILLPFESQHDFRFFRNRAPIEQDFRRPLERNHLLVTPSEQGDNREFGSVSQNAPSAPENSGTQFQLKNCLARPGCTENGGRDGGRSSDSLRHAGLSRRTD